jgi:hypothetical protein
MLLSWQRKKRLREGLAFRSLEPCSSCVLEVPEGVLGVPGVLGGRHGSSLVATEEWRKKVEKLGVGLWRRKVRVEWRKVRWSGCGCEMRWWE